MSDLIYETRDGIAYLTMDRPRRRNAISPQMMVELADAWRAFRDDPDARVAILTGAGNRAFCAGADLELLIPLLTRARAPEDEWDRRLLSDRGLTDVALLRGFELYKPVVAAVNGWALAGGTEILQATDIRIASPDAHFGLTEAARGLVPGGGSLARLQRQIPYCKAMEILLVGDPIPAEEAHRIGLINEIVPAEKLLIRTEEIARRIAANGPFAVRKIKETLIRTSGLPLARAFEIESECARQVMRSEDAREGPRAFMEKRTPDFTGR
ncbi:MAG: enoyl-CoA hydratase-related protein [Myxococcota bacterium]